MIIKERELAIGIIDFFEGLLADYDIDIDNEEKREYRRDMENEDLTEDEMCMAIIFGSDYYSMEDYIAGLLENTDMNCVKTETPGKSANTLLESIIGCLEGLLKDYDLVIDTDERAEYVNSLSEEEKSQAPRLYGSVRSKLINDIYCFLKRDGLEKQHA